MPGVFLSNVQIEEELSVCREDKNSKQLIHRISWKNKYLYIFLFVPVICILFIDWNPASVKMVDLPQKHPDFMGRTLELAQLKEKLFGPLVGGRVNLIVLYGEGGIGKTELAIAFANDHLNKFSLIAWLDGRSKESLIHSYAS